MTVNQAWGLDFKLIMVYTDIKDFEWDGRKAASNFIKHGLTFEEAITAFDDPFQLRAVDAKHSSASEKREWLIGEADQGVLVVVFTIRRPRDVCRIISARKAKRRERRQYEQIKRIPL